MSELELLQTTVKELTKRYEEIVNTNEKIFNSNASLTSMLSVISRSQNKLIEASNEIAEAMNITKVELKDETNNQENFNTLMLTIRTALGTKRESLIADKYTLNKYDQIVKAFETDIDLIRHFFWTSPKIEEENTGKNGGIRPLKTDPMKMSNLLTITQSFLKNHHTSFAKVTALKPVSQKLNTLTEALYKSYANVQAKDDENRIYVNTPSPEVIKEYPQFKQLLHIHSKLRRQLKDDSQTITTEINKMGSTLSQIKNELQQIAKKIDITIRDSTGASLQKQREAFIEASLGLVKLRAIAYIRAKSHSNLLTRYQDRIRTIIDREAAFESGIVDEDHLRRFLDAINGYKKELTEANEGINKLIQELERTEIIPLGHKQSEERISYGSYVALLEEQVTDGFACFGRALDAAASTAAEAEAFIRTADYPGLVFNRSRAVESLVAIHPEGAYLGQITAAHEANIAQKETLLKEISGSTEQMLNDSSRMRKSAESMKAQKGKAEQCKGCLEGRSALLPCGHSLCEECASAALKTGKCPQCGTEFIEADVIKINL